jgi:hypothetical protein
MAIDFDPSNAARNVARLGGNIAQDAIKKTVDPLNLFGSDQMSKGGGTARAQGAPGMPGGSSIEDILATMNKGNDKNPFDVSNAANGLFSAGKDIGNAAADAVGGASGAGGSQMMGQIMGIIKQLLPMIMGMLGGL